ncbi:MAG: DUF1343 domain-containing protein [Treponema sp.]|nr:DUF1343 domain-containing protein [Treponema sp.]
MKKSLFYVSAVFSLIFLLVSCNSEPKAVDVPVSDRVILGDEREDAYLPILYGKKVALFSNQTGIVGDKIILSDGTVQYGGFSQDDADETLPDSSLIPFGYDSHGKSVQYGEHILDVLLSRGINVTAIFSPEHGFRGSEDAGSSVNDSVDEKTGIPILSLYGNDSTKGPGMEDMSKFDVLVVDIQDVGLRYYTYYVSLFYLMDACAHSSKKVVILDRPNPNGFYVDGDLLNEEFRSPVGQLCIPTVHGMTLGELARMINGEGWLKNGRNSCDLTVIPCRNYSHETKYSLIRGPSPNLKDMRSVYLYSSLCFFENTMVSLGRGTEFPFEVYGSPYMESDFSFLPKSMQGAEKPPFLGQSCYGVDLREKSIAEILKEGINLSYLIKAYEEVNPKLAKGESFFLKSDSKDRAWIDFLSGSDLLRKQIMAGKSAEEIKASWSGAIEKFKKARKPYLLYSEGEVLSHWQEDVSFPDWIYTTNFSANNSIAFNYYSGQGKIFVTVSKECKAFSLYVNGRKIKTESLLPGNSYEFDISKITRNGRNVVQVSDIMPSELKNAVRVRIPYPEVTEENLKDSGISSDSIRLIDRIISSDIDNGFTSAQLAIIKDGKLIYRNSWGKIKSYDENGKVPDAPSVTDETLYDLASVSKMFAGAYAIQSLVSQERLSLDARIVDILGREFAENTAEINFKGGKTYPLERIKEWKENLTVRDVMTHSAGFSAGYPYFNDNCDISEGEFNTGKNKNLLFSGYDASPETRELTYRQICRTPLIYEPGSRVVYSDIDFMLICFIAEKVSGERLDVFLKDTFWKPMGLERICYRPMDSGFSKSDCAATDPTGNSYMGELSFSGCRTGTVQGEVHDGNAFYAMGQISAHAGLFSNATDLARLASVMLTGGYGNHKFFTRNVLDLFTSPQSLEESDFGLGWWRGAEHQIPRHFGTVCSSRAFGHQGFTGTLAFIEPEENLVIVYLTNKINTPMSAPKMLNNHFVGNYYQSSVVGFVPQIVLMGLKSNVSKAQWKSLVFDMSEDARRKAESADDKSDGRWKAFESLRNVYEQY